MTNDSIPCSMAIRLRPFKCTDSSCGRTHSAMEATQGLIAASADVVSQFKDFPADRNIMSILGDDVGPILLVYGLEMARVVGRVALVMKLEYDVLNAKDYPVLPGKVLTEAYEEAKKKLDVALQGEVLPESATSLMQQLQTQIKQMTRPSRNEPSIN
jgi:hypothetical protein